MSAMNPSENKSKLTKAQILSAPELRIGSEIDNPDMTIQTIINRPVVNTNKMSRFVLDFKGGVLDSNSRLQLSLDSSNANSFYARNVGVLGLLKRVRLLGNNGATIISECDDFNHLSAYHSLFLDGEHQVEHEQYTSNRCMGHQFLYDNTLTTQSNSDAVGIGINNGWDYDSSDLQNPAFLSIASKPIFSVSLKEMFPVLRRQIGLPTWLLENLVIEIFYETDYASDSNTGRICTASGQGMASTPIDLTQTKLMLDYVMYSQKQQEEMLDDSLQIKYHEYRLTKTSLSHTDATNFIRNLGGANRECSKIILGLADDNQTNDSIINKYNAVAVPLASTCELNVKYNDNFLYSGGDVKNNARHYFNLCEAEGLKPHITKQEYCNECEVLTTQSFEGHNQNNLLKGKFNWFSFRLNRGEKVNSRGVELYSKLATLTDLGGGKTYTQRAWLEVARQLVIDKNSGEVSVYWV